MTSTENTPLHASSLGLSGATLIKLIAAWRSCSMSKEKPTPPMTELEAVTMVGPLLRENEAAIDGIAYMTKDELLAGIERLKERKVNAQFHFQLVHHLREQIYFLVQRRFGEDRTVSVYCALNTYSGLDRLFAKYVPKKEGKVIRP